MQSNEMLLESHDESSIMDRAGDTELGQTDKMQTDMFMSRAARKLHALHLVKKAKKKRLDDGSKHPY